MTDQAPLNSGFGLRSTASDVIAGIDLSGKTALVTGGYSGLGLETVRALAGAKARVIVGARTTPTPSGDFYVEEALALDPAAAGGPYALATSASSEVLLEFNGGPGQIALHGTNHLFDPMGSATSHGCVRLSTRAITWLAGRIGRGVPLRIEG